MTRQVLHSPRLIAVLLLALLGRGLVPTGFMPASHTGLGFRLALCTATGLADAADAGAADAGAAGSADFHSPDDAPSPHDGGTQQRPCVYATAAVAAPPPVPPAPLLAHVPANPPAAIEPTTAFRPSVLRTQ
jgi:hypothetical protein